MTSVGVLCRQFRTAGRACRRTIEVPLTAGYAHLAIVEPVGSGKSKWPEHEPCEEASQGRITGPCNHCANESVREADYENYQNDGRSFHVERFCRVTKSRVNREAA